MTYIQYLQPQLRAALIFAYQNNCSLIRGYATKDGKLHKKSAGYLVKRGMIQLANDGSYTLTDLGYLVAKSLVKDDTAPSHFRRIDSAVDVDALIAENEALRAENAALQREKSKMRAALQVTVDTIEDHRNKVEMPPVLYNALTHVVLVVNSTLED